MKDQIKNKTGAPKSLKSDVLAKSAFKEILNNEGYTDVQITKAPSDIVASKDGEKWYFEIKMTRNTEVYFGAATLTEWEQAFKTPNNFFFVVAIHKEDGSFDFRRYTPQEFMKFSSLPPFKIYFNIHFNRNSTTSKRKSKAILLTEERFKTISEVYQSLRQELNDSEK